MKRLFLVIMPALCFGHGEEHHQMQHNQGMQHHQQGMQYNQMHQQEMHHNNNLHGNPNWNHANQNWNHEAQYNSYQANPVYVNPNVNTGQYPNAGQVIQNWEEYNGTNQ